MRQRLIEFRKLLFLSTLSLRRATTLQDAHHFSALFLSTLSLRRATGIRHVTKARSEHFYPRSPCGERQPAERHANSQQEFLSTLSLRRATGHAVNLHPETRFLSTLSLRRATEFRKLLNPGSTNFYPRSPCGERPSQSKHCAQSM